MIYRRHKLVTSYPSALSEEDVVKKFKNSEDYISTEVYLTDFDVEDNQWQIWKAKKA